MRLDKYLSNAGIGSRKDVKKMIKDERVLVNNHLVKSEKFNVDENKDIVLLDNQKIDYRQFYYVLINKPQNYVSSTLMERNYPPITDLVSEYSFANLFPVGRLDVDTEGLLLISNDGKLTHEVLSPKKHVDKKYYVEFDGTLPENAVDFFNQPMKFEEFTSAPSKLEILDTNKAYLTIHEGKFHQVKRMFEKANCTVTYLQRIEFGPLKLNDLPLGEFRALTQEELDALKG